MIITHNCQGVMGILYFRMYRKIYVYLFKSSSITEEEAWEEDKLVKCKNPKAGAHNMRHTSRRIYKLFTLSFSCLLCLELYASNFLV